MEDFVLRPRELGLGAGLCLTICSRCDLDPTVDPSMTLIGGADPPGAIESIR